MVFSNLATSGICRQIHSVWLEPLTGTQGEEMRLSCAAVGTRWGYRSRKTIRPLVKS